MSTSIEGDLIHRGGRYAIVVARFNDFITARLLDGALGTLGAHGVDRESVPVVWVPGAFEMPLAAKRLADSGQFDAVIALGCVIRGGTPHFDYVVEASSWAGCSWIRVPIMFGLLTTENIEQAIERAGTKMGNRREAAMAAMEMVNAMNARRTPELRWDDAEPEPCASSATAQTCWVIALRLWCVVVHAVGK